jgi:hypothetical protein
MAAQKEGLDQIPTPLAFQEARTPDQSRLDPLLLDAPSVTVPASFSTRFQSLSRISRLSDDPRYRHRLLATNLKVADHD